MATNNSVGEDSLYVVSSNRGILASILAQNNLITAENKNIILKYTKKSPHIWWSAGDVYTIDGDLITEIPKEMTSLQELFINIEAEDTYDKNTIRSLLPTSEGDL